MRARLSVLCALALLLAACSSEGSPFSSVPGGTGQTTAAGATTTQGSAATSTTTVATTTTEAPTTTLVVPVWTRVTHDEAVFGGAGWQGMWGLAAGGPGLVAVGEDYAGGDGDAAVWTSADGVIWTRVLHDEAVFGGVADQEMLSVALGGPGLVAVGFDSSGGEEDAAVWVSGDGLFWSRVPHDESIFGGYCHQFLWDVAPGGPGLVAVGYDCSGDDGDAAVWYSPDGWSWSRVAHDEAVFGGALEQEMVSVAAAGSGLVAVGYDSSGGDLDAAVWYSPDAVTWYRAAHDEAVFGGVGDQEMRDVLYGGPGLVAVGYDSSGGDLDAGVWVSADGITWSRAPHDETILGGDGAQEMTAAVLTGSGLVAVGNAGSGESVSAAVWYSADGVTWVRVPHDEAVFGGDGNQGMWRVVMGGSGLVAVGGEESGEDATAAVWAGPLPG